jgi:uncharacterized protein
LRKSFNLFLLVFTALHILLTAYVGFRSADHWVWWVVLLVLALLLWSLPAIHWRRGEEKEDQRLKNFLIQLSYISMVVMSWLLVLTVSRDLVFLVSKLISDSWHLEISGHWTGTLNFILAFSLTLVGTWRAIRGPIIRNVKIPFKNLSADLHGLKIVQITDLHVGPTIGRAYVEKVVRLAKSLNPDLTVLTGDIVDGKFRDHRHAIESFAELGPRGRVFYSPGNHEYYHRIDEWLPEFERLGATILMNRGEQIRFKETTLWIGGVTDPAAGHFSRGQEPDPGRAARGGENSAFRLLLSHRPGFAELAEKAGFDLQLSGHTHGGQFFPWTFVARFFHQYLLGLFKHGKMWLYVGPGTGTWGPQARIGTTAEITCLELVLQT